MDNDIADADILVHVTQTEEIAIPCKNASQSALTYALVLESILTVHCIQNHTDQVSSLEFADRPTRIYAFKNCLVSGQSVLQ